MEASTVAAPPEVLPEAASFDGEAEATRSTEELFEWSGYVHVGGDAATCEHRGDGECDDSRHFHAWVCLPNVYQIRDIVDKARAAKARKIRALRDAGGPTARPPHEPSDSYVTLEAELDELRTRRDELLDTITKRKVDERLTEIITGLRDDDRFEHHDQDAEEFRRLTALPEDERDAAEYEQLQAHMVAYGDAMTEALDAETAAEKARLGKLPLDDLIEMERQRRIDDLGWETYNHTFYTWAIFTGTRVPSTKGFPSARKFKTPDEQKDAPPEALRALRQKITDLENRTTSARSDAAGN